VYQERIDAYGPHGFGSDHARRMSPPMFVVLYGLVRLLLFMQLHVLGIVFAFVLFWLLFVVVLQHQADALSQRL
jgi:hypothetical protein